MKKRNYNIFKILMVLIIILIVFLNFNYPLFYNEEVELYSEIFQVDKYLIYSIIKAESNFDKNATSEKNAKGLMQLLDSTAEEIFIELKVSDEYRDLYNPESNIMAGTYYISKLLDNYGDYDKAVAAYNSGIGNVNQWNMAEGDFRDNILFKETENYLNKVERFHKTYKFLYKTLSLSFLTLPDIFVKFKVFIQKIFRIVRRFNI